MRRSLTIVALLSVVTFVSVAWGNADSNQETTLVGAQARSESVLRMRAIVRRDRKRGRS